MRMRTRVGVFSRQYSCCAIFMLSDTPLDRTDSFSSYILFAGVNYAGTAMANEQINAARRRTFTQWLNLQLRSTKLRVKDLEKDLASGVILIRLLQILSPHKKVMDK